MSLRGSQPAGSTEFRSWHKASWRVSSQKISIK